MLESLSLASTTLSVAGPAFNGLANLARALKEPFGKKRMEGLRTEFADTFEQLSELVEQQSQVLNLLQREVADLRAEVEYLRLPFWKRWFGRQRSG